MLFIHNCKTRSQIFRKLAIVCDRDQRFSCIMKVFKKIQKHILRLLIQTGKRLIQDQHLRIQGKNTCKRNLSLLTSAQMIRWSFSSFSISKQTKTILCSLPDFCLRKPHLNRSKRNFLFHASAKQLCIRVLKKHIPSAGETTLQTACLSALFSVISWPLYK